jgi:hypothetical protein
MIRVRVNDRGAWSIIHIDKIDHDLFTLPNIAYEPKVLKTNFWSVSGGEFIGRRLGNSTGDSRGRFQFANLIVAGKSQPKGGGHQDDSSDKQSECEIGELPGVLSQFCVRLLFFSIGVRYPLAFLSFISAISICLLGWHNFYNERRLFGSALILGAILLGNWGVWLLSPHLLSAPL